MCARLWVCTCETGRVGIVTNLHGPDEVIEGHRGDIPIVRAHYT